MKKLLSTVLLVFLVGILISSCNRDELLPSETGDIVVTFNIGTENVISTRAASSTSGTALAATRLTYAIFDSEGNYIANTKDYADGSVVDGKLTWTLNIPLIKDNTYNLVFWAQDPDCGAFTLTDDMNLTVDYSKVKNNDLSYDAFYAVESITVSGNLNKTVTLKRPFAQVNVGTSELDFAKADALADYTGSSITLSKVSNTMNLLDGTLGAVQEVTFATNGFLNEALVVNGTNYKCLSMCYVLASETSSLVDNVTVNINYTEEESSKTLVRTVANVPIRRNYRTNIYGNILTDGTNILVNTDGGFAAGDQTPTGNVISSNSSQDDINTMVANGGVITVDNSGTSYNIDLSKVTKDTYLNIEGPVSGTVKVGGNSPISSAAAASTRAGESYPEVVIEVSKDVAYPTFEFSGKAVNVTIKGDLNTRQPLSSTIAVNKEYENLTFNGIVSTGANILDLWFGNGSNVSITDCKATNMTRTFIKVNNSTNVRILNNEIHYVQTSESDSYKHGIEVFHPRETLIVEGNIVTNANKHGIMLNHAESAKVTIKGNIINGADEDGIKTDHSNNVDIHNNIINNVDEHGIRVDRLDGPIATVSITDNEISSKSENGSYGIKVNYRANEDANEAGSVTVNLTAKDNVVGEDGIADNRYFNAEAEGMTLTGDYQIPITLSNGIAVMADGSFAVKSVDELAYVTENIAGSDIRAKIIEDINGAVTINQKKGVRLVVDGNNHKWDGRVILHNADKNDAFDGETLMLENINFESSTISDPFIYADDKIDYIYNLTIEDCKFKYTGTEKDIVVLASRQNNDVVIRNCEAEGVHSLVQNNGGEGLTVENVVVKNSIEGGLNLSGQIKDVLVRGCRFYCAESINLNYGIRVNANVAGNAMTISDCEFSAHTPILLRNATVGFNLTLMGKNTLNATNTYHYQIIAACDNWQGNFEELKVPTDNVTITITGADGMKIYPESLAE